MQARREPHRPADDHDDVGVTRPSVGANPETGKPDPAADRALLSPRHPAIGLPVKPPARPLLVDTLSDLGRSGLETLRLSLRLRSLVAEAPPGDGHPVLTLPGYGGGDASMSLLRLFLRRIGYAPIRLGLGVNAEPAERTIRSVDDALSFRALMVERVVERIREIHATTGEHVSLVGWSLGGLHAFDAAREAPDCVRGVITLGAPYGDPRGTSLFSLLRWLSGSDVPIDAQDFAGWIARSEPAP